MNLNRIKRKVHKFYRKTVFILPSKAKPDFLIIGAQKAGTTTLYNFLVGHPKLQGALIKEVHFFNNERNFARGYPWYEKHFKNLNPFRTKTMFFEGTPEYMLSEDWMKRIQQYNPLMKFIVILREPVSRTYSAWNFFRKLGAYRESVPGFEESVEREMTAIGGGREDLLTSLQFIRRGIYVQQLERCFAVFDRDRFLILGSKELEKDPKATLNRVLTFLGLPQDKWSALRMKKRNVGVYQQKMDETLRKRLQDFFEPYNRELFKLLGFKPDW